MITKRYIALDSIPIIWKRFANLFQTSLYPVKHLVKLRSSANCWVSYGNEPQFSLKLGAIPFHGGWIRIQLKVCYRSGEGRPKLSFDFGKGFNGASVEFLPLSQSGEVDAVIKISGGVAGIRFVPMEMPGEFTLERVSIRWINPARAALQMLMRITEKAERRPLALKQLIGKCYARAVKHGLSGMMTRLNKDYQRATTGRLVTGVSYDGWVAVYDTLDDADKAAIRRHISHLSWQPMISVVMPVFNTPENFLYRAIESVVTQLYSNWELCIANDASTEPHVRHLLDRYSKKDARIKVTNRELNGHISAASNSALEMVAGEFVAFLDHDDELAEHALYRVVCELNRHPEAQLLYSDEDIVDENGNRLSHHFKPDWNPEFFYAVNYICHLAVYRTALVKTLGGFRRGFEGSQDYDLALRCTARIAPNHIRHIPEILYHWRAIDGSTAKNAAHKCYATGAGLNALQEHFQLLEIEAIVEQGPLPTTYRVRYPISGSKPKVSLIIPTRNGYRLIHQCVQSIFSKTEYSNYQIIIVDNQTNDEKTLDYFKSLECEKRVKVLKYPFPFNYSAINNFAVRHADGDVIGLLNNDTEIISPEWLDEMVSHAIQPDVGAVGAKLLYPDGRIQHAGVILGLGGLAAHSHRLFRSDDAGYLGRLVLTQELSAVTAACMVLRKVLFEKVGGFNEKDLPIAYNDVDLCLRLRTTGYRIVWTPHALLYHHESASRGLEDTPHKQGRFAKETDYMRGKWGDKLLVDPFYNPNLTLDREDFSLAWPSRKIKPWFDRASLISPSQPPYRPSVLSKYDKSKPAYGAKESF